eukprot:557901-Hanusia_phi.AAC.1
MIGSDRRVPGVTGRGPPSPSHADRTGGPARGARMPGAVPGSAVDRAGPPRRHGGVPLIGRRANSSLSGPDRRTLGL